MPDLSFFGVCRLILLGIRLPTLAEVLIDNCSVAPLNPQRKELLQLAAVVVFHQPLQFRHGVFLLPLSQVLLDYIHFVVLFELDYMLVEPKQNDAACTWISQELLYSFDFQLQDFSYSSQVALSAIDNSAR